MGLFDRISSKKADKDEPVLPVVKEEKPKLRFSDEKVDKLSDGDRGLRPGPGVGVVVSSESSGSGNSAAGGESSTRAKPTRSNTSKATVKKIQSPRPGLQRHTTAQTRYIEMLLSLDQIPRLDNILASFLTWLLLAGYIVFPATFTSVTTDTKIVNVAQGNVIGIEVLSTVKNAPLLYVAAFCCGIGALGMCWLWWKHHRNYVWVINRIFLPGFTSSVAGLISTITNIYSAQGGQYSITAKATTIVTSSCSVVLALLFLLYNNWALQRIKSKHERETAAVRQTQERRDEGMLEMVRRKAHEPALEPESVV